MSGDPWARGWNGGQLKFQAALSRNYAWGWILTRLAQCGPYKELTATIESDKSPGKTPLEAPAPFAPLECVSIGKDVKEKEETAGDCSWALPLSFSNMEWKLLGFIASEIPRAAQKRSQKKNLTQHLAILCGGFFFPPSLQSFWSLVLELPASPSHHP